MLSTEENGAKLASNRLLRRYPQFRFDLGHQGGFVFVSERFKQLMRRTIFYTDQRFDDFGPYFSHKSIYFSNELVRLILTIFTHDE